MKNQEREKERKRVMTKIKTPIGTIDPVEQYENTMDKINKAKKEFDENFIVGMTTKEATSEMQKRGLRLRVVCQDGRHMVVTRDLRPDRLNVEVANDLVIRVLKWG